VVEGTTTIPTIELMLIVTTNNGKPHALDPNTLQTKGRLVDVVPKLKAVFPEGNKCMAHTRYNTKRGVCHRG